MRSLSHAPAELAIPALALMVLAFVCAGSVAAAEDDPVATPEVPRAIPPGDGRIRQFLGCELPDGERPRVSVSARDMPWRVAIGLPRGSPKFGSQKEGRDAAIAAMRQWEHAIQTRLPWFVLEFVEKDPEAQVVVTWKRRTTGAAQGRGGPTCWRKDGELRAGGRLEVAVRACPTCTPLTVDEIAMLFAHEFGHVLGLGHCLDCDSAMNYSWQTRDRVFVTGVDVEAVVRRFAAFDAQSGPFDPEDAVAAADGSEPIDFAAATCDSLSLTRSCSDRKGGALQRTELGGVAMRLAGSDDGTKLLMMPLDPEVLGPGGATAASNERYSVLLEELRAQGLGAIHTAPMVIRSAIVGYYVEFDGDAWTALGL